MNNIKLRHLITIVLIPGFIISLTIACKKYLPEERETIGADSQFTNTVFQPILGRTTVFENNFYKGSTTYPVDFKIINPRRRNGDPAPELTDVFPVTVWKSGEAYTGEEKSMEEIDAKREKQNRNLFEIYPNNGNFVLWSEANSSFMRAMPDSGYVFDVEVSNSGGRRYFRDLKLMPYREQPYAPSGYDAISGQQLTNGVPPSVVSFIKGDTSNRYLSPSDIDVYIRKIVNPLKTHGQSLTFKFLDKDYRYINPAKFTNTNWEGLVHGFNMQKTDSSVSYNVAFPIPLVELRTRYTNANGNMAVVRFGYSRIGFAGSRENAVLGLDFAIYEPGDWEIVFAFKNDNPKFSDD